MCPSDHALTICWPSGVRRTELHTTPGTEIRSSSAPVAADQTETNGPHALTYTLLVSSGTVNDSTPAGLTTPGGAVCSSRTSRELLSTLHKQFGPSAYAYLHASDVAIDPIPVATHVTASASGDGAASCAGPSCSADVVAVALPAPV